MDLTEVPRRAHAGERERHSVGPSTLLRAFVRDSTVWGFRIT